MDEISAGDYLASAIFRDNFIGNQQTTKGQLMEEPTQEQYLDSALDKLMAELLLWGICDNDRTSELGYRTPEVLRLSVGGATHLVALVNTLNGEIRRLSLVVGELYTENGGN